MELKFKKEDLEKLLIGYYKAYEYRDVKVNASASKGLVGYGMSEQESAVVEIKVSGTIDIAETKTEFSEILTKDKLTEIIGVILKDNGFETQSLSYHAGLTNDDNGNKTAYFNGIKVNCEKIEKNKTL